MLAARISQKIDAVLAGKPEPPPVLPLAEGDELRADAWKMRDLGKRLWGDEAVTIAIYDGDGIPRSVPAKRLGDNDYIVPLRHLDTVFQPRRTLDFETRGRIRGDDGMKVNQHAAQLSRAVQSRQGEILVPLASVVQHGLGKSISWEQRDDMMIARVE